MEITIQEKLKGKKILFATVPASGHVNPLTGLAKYLQQQGCDVRWYTSGIFEKKITDLQIPFYKFVKAADINQENLDTLFPERKEIADPGMKMDFDLLNLFAKRGEEYLSDIAEIHGSFPFVLMISDSMFTGIPLVKHVLNIPVVSIGIIPLPTDSAALAPYGLAMPPATNDAELNQYAELKELMKNVIFKQSLDYQSNTLAKLSIPHDRAMLFDLLIKQSNLCLQIGSPSFEYYRSSLYNNIVFVGALLPFVNTESTEKWFDPRLKIYKKILLVTHGTVEKDSSKLLTPTLEAFNESDVLVVATTGGNGTAELKKKFNAPNVIIEDFIPFADIMPHADVYVTNGGYGGTILSIQYNLPMVAAGIHEGKNEVCARIAYFKLGINLLTETPAAENIRDAVKEVLNNTFYKENLVRLSEEMNSIHSEERCAELIAKLF
jgi:MGT family glycosyltransferase